MRRSNSLLLIEMKIFSFLIFVASLINATHIHAADIDHKDSWLGGILKFATSKKYQRSGLSGGTEKVLPAHAGHGLSRDCVPL